MRKRITAFAGWEDDQLRELIEQYKQIAKADMEKYGRFSEWGLVKLGELLQEKYNRTGTLEAIPSALYQTLFPPEETQKPVGTPKRFNVVEQCERYACEVEAKHIVEWAVSIKKPRGTFAKTNGTRETVIARFVTNLIAHHTVIDECVKRAIITMEQVCEWVAIAIDKEDDPEQGTLV